MASDDPTLIEIKERLARLESDVGWLKWMAKKLEGRTWWIIATILLNIILAVALKLT
jgi:hypothetical protein